MGFADNTVSARVPSGAGGGGGGVSLHNRAAGALNILINHAAIMIDLLRLFPSCCGQERSTDSFTYSNHLQGLARAQSWKAPAQSARSAEGLTVYQRLHSSRLQALTASTLL